MVTADSGYSMVSGISNVPLLLKMNFLNLLTIANVHIL